MRSEKIYQNNGTLPQNNQFLLLIFTPSHYEIKHHHTPLERFSVGKSETATYFEPCFNLNQWELIK